MQKSNSNKRGILNEIGKTKPQWIMLINLWDAKHL